MCVLFQNHQWVVTERGVESIEPPQARNMIEAHRLLERLGVGQGQFYDWPVHMAKKSWVDIEAFIEAFSRALDLLAGRYEGRVDPDMLRASISEARREAENRAELHMPVGEAQFKLGKETEAPPFPEKEAPPFPEKEAPPFPEKEAPLFPEKEADEKSGRPRRR